MLWVGKGPIVIFAEDTQIARMVHAPKTPMGPKYLGLVNATKATCMKSGIKPSYNTLNKILVIHR